MRRSRPVASQPLPYSAVESLRAGRGRSWRLVLLVCLLAVPVLGQEIEDPAGRIRPAVVGTEVATQLVTEHPYWGPGTGDLQLVSSVEIHDPDASYISPHFARFELADGDFVVVRSPEGDRSWAYRGKGKGELGRTEGFWASHIPGDTAVVELFSRNDMGSYGYEIDRYARGFRPDELAAQRRLEKEICGADDSDWSICYEMSEATIYARSQAVARLLINGTELCTGWLLGSEGHLMTNNHCIGDATDAANVDVEFLAEGASCATDCAFSLACPGTTVATSSTLVATDADQDYTLVLLPTDPTPTYGYLQLDSELPTNGDRIYIPQHPQGWGKRIAVESTDAEDESGYAELSNQLLILPEEVLHWTYFADTEGGSSGSPVLAYEDHRVVALHRAATSCTGHGNIGVQAIEILDSLRDVLPNDAAEFTVDLTIDGSGTGSVTSSGGGIDCPGDCSEVYSANSAVTLTASAGANSVFTGWSGDDADCDDGELSVNAHLSCTATFDLETRTLTVSTNGDGSGSVTSSPSGINCPGDCSEGYEHGQVVDLTATPDSGDQFAGWSGDADCSDGQVTMTADLSCAATFQVPTIYYVDADAMGMATGDSWADAFTSPQDALAVALDGDQIWVAEGVYTPATSVPSADPTVTFELVDGVEVYGGFAGTESTLAERDTAAHVTILSGDIGGDDTNTDGNSIAETWSDIQGTNAYHVVTAAGTSADTVLDGLVITAGYASGAGNPDGRGAAVFCDTGGSPTFVDLTVIGNRTSDRAALAACESMVTSSRFEANYSDGVAAVANEGGTFVDTVFIGNESVSQAPVFYLGIDDMLTLTRCKVLGNVTNGAGSIRVFRATVDFDDVLFSGNSSRDGAAIHFTGTSGGGTLTNVTVSGNIGSRYGAVYMASSGSLTVENSILWNNQDQSGTGTLDSALYDAGTGSVTVYSSILQASGGSDAWSAGAIVDGGGNLDVDPQFIDPLDPSAAPSSDGDFHLKAGSLALDAGDDSLVTSSTDLDGENRIQDAAVDLGPFEGAEGADLSITLDDGVTSAVPGEPLTYTVVAASDGPSDVESVSVATDFAADLTCDWTSVATGGAGGNGSGSGNVAETLSLPSGSSVTYIATCDIDPAATGTLASSATVSSAAYDPDEGNDAATDDDTALVASADLTITLTDGIALVLPGDVLTYSLVATNEGPSNATSVSMSALFDDDLSCNWSSVAAGGASGNGSGSGNIGETLDLPTGASVTYTAECAVDIAASEILSTSASLSAAATDPNGANNAAADDTAVLEPLFEDGFESGDFTAWSSSVP